MLMKKHNILVIILSLILVFAAAASLATYAGSFASTGKRTAADHTEFRKAVRKQVYIDRDIYEKMVEKGDYSNPVLAIRAKLKNVAGFYADFDYDWYYNYDFEYDPELEKLIRKDSVYTSYEIYSIYTEGFEIDCDQTGMLEFFTFDNDDDAQRFAELRIKEYQWPSNSRYNEIKESNYSRFTLESGDMIAVIARIDNTVIEYDGTVDSPAYKVLEKLGYY